MDVWHEVGSHLILSVSGWGVPFNFISHVENSGCEGIIWMTHIFKGMLGVLYNKEEPSRKLLALFAWDRNKVGFSYLGDGNITQESGTHLGPWKSTVIDTCIFPYSEQQVFITMTSLCCFMNFFFPRGTGVRSHFFPLSKREI